MVIAKSKFAVPLEYLLGDLKEFLKVFIWAKFSDYPHERTWQILGVQRSQHAAHIHIIPLKHTHNFMVAITVRIQSKNWSTSRYLNFNSHISFCHDIIDAKSSSSYFFNQFFFFFIAWVFWSGHWSSDDLLISYGTPKSWVSRCIIIFATLLVFAILGVLIDTIRNIGSYTCAASSIYPIHVVIVSSSRPIYSLQLLQKLRLLLQFYLKVAQIWRTKLSRLLTIHGQTILSHFKCFRQTRFWFNSLDQFGGFLNHDKTSSRIWLSSMALFICLFITQLGCFNLLYGWLLLFKFFEHFSNNIYKFWNRINIIW